jgi:hypothetical protein
MAGAHSFLITLANNKTESEGLEIVLAASRDLFVPDKHGRKELLKLLDLGKNFSVLLTSCEWLGQMLIAIRFRFQTRKTSHLSS